MRGWRVARDGLPQIGHRWSGARIRGARRPTGTGCPTKMAGAPGPGGPAGDPVAPEDTPDAHEEHDRESRGAYSVILLHVILRWQTTAHA